MPRRELWVVALLGAALAAGDVSAGEVDDGDAVTDPATTAASQPTPASGELRAYLTAQLDAQLEVAHRTRRTVEDKRDVAADERAHRTRTAYKLLRAGTAPAWVDNDERMATARRRAGARWLLSRDRREVDLLADEAEQLAAAEARLTRDRAVAATIPLPAADLLPPVAGTIVRRFGPLLHERSKAHLSRHGLDYDTADGADVHAVADGVVRYAGPIRGLDAGLVIDHGTCVSVLGKLAAPTLAIGDRVTRGQVVGHAARRRVYLEVRVPVGPGGVPVDPERLLAAPAPAAGAASGSRATARAR